MKQFKLMMALAFAFGLFTGEVIYAASPAISSVKIDGRVVVGDLAVPEHGSGEPSVIDCANVAMAFTGRRSFRH